MYQIEMVEDHMLVEKVETQKSEFINTGEADKQGAIFRILHAPKGSDYQPEQLVLLRPETYPGFYFEGKLYTKIVEDDIIAKVTEGK